MTLVIVVDYRGAERYYCVPCCAESGRLRQIPRPAIWTAPTAAMEHVYADVHKSDTITIKAVGDMQAARHVLEEWRRRGGSDMMRTVNKCPECGSSYEPSNSNQIYCSRPCRRRSNHDSHQKPVPCAGCGEEFIPPQGKILKVLLPGLRRQLPQPLRPRLPGMRHAADAGRHRKVRVHHPHLAVRQVRPVARRHGERTRAGYYQNAGRMRHLRGGARLCMPRAPRRHQLHHVRVGVHHMRRPDAGLVQVQEVKARRSGGRQLMADCKNCGHDGEYHANETEIAYGEPACGVTCLVGESNVGIFAGPCLCKGYEEAKD